MTNSFYKKGSNAKIMNNLSFNLISTEDEIVIKNNKNEINIKIGLEDIIEINQIKNKRYRDFCINTILIKKGIEWILNNTEEKYHKYITIKIKCFSIYTENALKEWMYRWFNDNIEDNNCKVIYRDDLYNIYNQFKKCKITVN